MGAIGAGERQRIEDFLLDYVHTIDDRDVGRWPGFFAEHGRYQITTRDNHEAGRPLGIMLCTSRAMMSDRMLALETANVFEPHSYCHVLGRPRLECIDGARIGARANFTVVRTMQDGHMELFAAGKYLDEIAVVDGRPEFLRRVVVLDSSRVDILIVYPL